MRGAGTIIGLFVLYACLIPGTYSATPEHAARSAARPAASWARGPTGLETAAVEGRVYDARGRPLPDATISLVGSGLWPERSVQTDDGGRFDWAGIPPGIYELQASKGQLAAPPVQGLVLEPGSRRAFAFRLEPAWSLAGRIIDRETGRPVGGAHLTSVTGSLGLHPRQARSDADGGFELQGIPADYLSLYVKADGYVSEGPLTYRREDSPIALLLERAAVIEGRVLDASGQPVEDARVQASSAETDVAGLSVPRSGGLGVTAGPLPPISAAPGNLPAFAKQVTTGYDGTFSIRDLRAGEYSLVIQDDEHAPAQAGPVSVRAGSLRHLPDIVLERGAELVGQVLDQQGRGLEAIPVQLQSGADGPPRIAITGPDGSFSFRGVRADVVVTALPYDLPPVRRRLSIADDALVRVELTLSGELYTLRGQVVDESGAGVEGALVTVSSDNPNTPVSRTAKSDSDGSFSVPALPRPPFTLRAEHPSFSSVRLLEVEPLEGIRVVLSAGVRLLGQVVDDWGAEALHGVAVTLRGPVEAHSQTRVDGTFVFDQIPPGTYDASFDHPEYEPRTERVVVERPRYADRPQTLQTIGLEPGGVIEGEVLDEHNEPVAGAEVTWGEPPRWNRAVRTDASGEFELRGVPAGSVWLAARHPAAGEAASPEPTTVRARQRSSGAYVRLPGSPGPSSW